MHINETYPSPRNPETGQEQATTAMSDNWANMFSNPIAQHDHELQKFKSKKGKVWQNKKKIQTGVSSDNVVNVQNGRVPKCNFQP